MQDITQDTMNHNKTHGPIKYLFMEGFQCLYSTQGFIYRTQINIPSSHFICIHIRIECTNFLQKQCISNGCWSVDGKTYHPILTCSHNQSQHLTYYCLASNGSHQRLELVYSCISIFFVCPFADRTNKLCVFSTEEHPQFA